VPGPDIAATLGFYGLRRGSHVSARPGAQLVEDGFRLRRKFAREGDSTENIFEVSSSLIASRSNTEQHDFRRTLVGWDAMKRHAILFVLFFLALPASGASVLSKQYTSTWVAPDFLPLGTSQVRIGQVQNERDREPSVDVVNYSFRLASWACREQDTFQRHRNELRYHIV